MDLAQPRPKKHCRLKPSPPLPVIQRADGEIHKFSGTFDGFAVTVAEESDMKRLISMGYFGKANLSRTYPQFRQTQPEIVRERVFRRRKSWGQARKRPPKKVIVVPDSDVEDYFTDLKPRYEMDHSGIKESVHLSLEESFFLAAATDCLDIRRDDRLLGLEEIWELFGQSDKYFVQNYVAYYHFRAKNWVAKTGIKFGGDFLLYKQGPPFYHASYVVIIDVLDESLKRIERLSRRSMDIVTLMGLNRLCETAGKELLICQIIWPSGLDTVKFTDLPRFTIREVAMKRWLASQERQDNQ